MVERPHRAAASEVLWQHRQDARERATRTTDTAMGALFRDLRFAWRQLRRRPVFAVGVVATLAMAIGLNTAVFSVVNAALLKPLPVAAPSELVRIYSIEPRDLVSHAPMAPADFVDLRELPGFAGVAAYRYAPLVLQDLDESRLVMGELVTGDYFSVLGVRPHLGALLDAQQDQLESARPVVVLSYTAWERRFSADPTIVGRAVRVNGRVYTIIGVAPPTFFGLTRGVVPELWLPLGSRPGPSPRLDRAGRGLWVIGRVEREVEAGQLRGQIDILAARLQTEYPATNRDRRFVVLPADAVRFLPSADTAVYATFLTVLGLVLLVLLIASANIGGLLLARAAGRRQELAIRLALGSGARGLVRLLLAEGLLLSLAGAVCGLGVAWSAAAMANAVRLPVPVDLALGIGIDQRVLAFTLLIAVLTALSFAVGPALHALRTDPSRVLHGEGGAPPPRRRMHAALVVVQVAVSLLLLACAGLAVRSLQQVNELDLGFDPERVAVATFAPRLQGYSGVESRRFLRELVDRVSALTTVQAAAVASHLPLTFEMAFARVVPEGQAPASVDEWPLIDTAAVGPGYFDAMGIPLGRGRIFTDRDRDTTPPVAVVNEQFAQRFWPDGDALGRRLLIDPVTAPVTIIGVVPNGRYRTAGEPCRPFFFRPFAQTDGRVGTTAGVVTTGTTTLVIRTTGPPAQILSPLQTVIRDLDDAIAITRLSTLRTALAPALALPPLLATLLGLFALLGLGLAATGLYALMAVAVSQRSREMGIRQAVGAQRQDILRLILWQAFTMTGTGMLLGLIGAVMATRLLSRLLYGVTPVDPVAYAVAVTVLIAVALGAASIPARRAARADLMVTLRAE